MCFTNLLTEFDYIMLLESWTCKISNTELDGYHCFNMYRKYRNRNAWINSGGIIVYVRNEYKNGITLVRNKHDTTVWFKFDKMCFNNGEYIYVPAVYLWSDDSPIVNVIDADLFVCLHSDIEHLFI